jgi:hypothetical protein
VDRNAPFVAARDRCPLLFGKEGTGPGGEVAPADDGYRRLLKARHQALTQFLFRFLVRVDLGHYQSIEMTSFSQALENLREVDTELWADDPKTLVPRLEEVVTLAADFERWTSSRVRAGTDPPQQLDLAKSYRLAAEAAVWKAKNAKGGAGRPPGAGR